MGRLHAVLETDAFIRHAKAIMSDEERADIVSFLAANPEAGVPLGGGVRKVRVARPGGGKSGGFRTIYVYAGEAVPLFLLTVFAKNAKSTLSRSELAAAMVIGRQLVNEYGGRS